MINHLSVIKDPVVTKLHQHELVLIINENAYHSPEESEEDPEEKPGDIKKENKIIIRDLA